MAFSKAHRFDPSDYHYSLLCRVLSHPARIAILRRLRERGPSPVKVLISGMPISPAAASQHLKILREMQIVKCRQEFPEIVYWLNSDLPNTYQGILDLLLRAEGLFDQRHKAELASVSRFARATAEGI